LKAIVQSLPEAGVRHPAVAGFLPVATRFLRRHPSLPAGSAC